MKKGLIISDTHMPRFSKTIPPILSKYLNEVEIIIHAGDFQTYDVYENFKTYKEIIAVYGNNDDKRLKQELKDKCIFTIEKIRIGLYHGCGVLSKAKISLSKTMSVFKDEALDLIIFGHSHKPFLKRVNNTTYFNPGSPTNKRLEKFYSFGLLTVADNDFTLKHIFYEHKNG